MGLNPKRIAKAAKDFTIKLDFKNKKFPLQIRDIHKIGKRNSIGNRSFVYQEKHATHVPKKCYKEKQVDVLLVGKKGKRHYVLLKNVNTSMYDHILQCERKHFCHSFLQAFIIKNILNCHMKNHFKIDGKLNIIMPKKTEYVKFRNH